MMILKIKGNLPKEGLLDSFCQCIILNKTTVTANHNGIDRVLRIFILFFKN